MHEKTIMMNDYCQAAIVRYEVQQSIEHYDSFIIHSPYFFKRKHCYISLNLIRMRSTVSFVDLGIIL